MLHGEVKINDHELCAYQITNEGQGLFDSDKDIYRAVVWGTDRRGYKYSMDWEFEARTSAPGLVGMVLTEVDSRFNPKNNHSVPIN